MQTAFKAEALWGEIILLNEAVPAIIKIKSQTTYLPVQMLVKGGFVGVELLKELRDEPRERANDGIAAVPNEKLRLILSTPPPLKLTTGFSCP